MLCVCSNAAVLQPVVGGGKEMENVFWMESRAEVSLLPAQGGVLPQLLCSMAPGLAGGSRSMGQHPWVLDSPKYELRMDSALNAGPHVQ